MTLPYWNKLEGPIIQCLRWMQWSRPDLEVDTGSNWAPYTLNKGARWNKYPDCFSSSWARLWTLQVSKTSIFVVCWNWNQDIIPELNSLGMVLYRFNVEWQNVAPLQRFNWDWSWAIYGFISICHFVRQEIIEGWRIKRASSYERCPLGTSLHPSGFGGSLSSRHLGPLTDLRPFVRAVQCLAYTWRFLAVRL